MERLTGLGNACAKAGLAVALLAAATARGDAPAPLRTWLAPGRYAWALVFVAVFLWQVLLANLDVAYRILHPRMPIRPGIVKIRTTLRTPAARTLLANAITLTPGTLTVDMTDDGWLMTFVHDLNTDSAELAVLDAQDFDRGYVARVELPQRVPYGFHGNWVSDSSVAPPEG